MELKDQVIETLKTIFDPEIPVNIYELGLIYEVNVDEARNVILRYTLTSPNCPAAQSLPGEMEDKLKGIPEINNLTLTLVWDPPWGPDKMSEAARLQLGMF